MAILTDNPPEGHTRSRRPQCESAELRTIATSALVIRGVQEAAVAQGWKPECWANQPGLSYPLFDEQGQQIYLSTSEPAARWKNVQSDGSMKYAWGHANSKKGEAKPPGCDFYHVAGSSILDIVAQSNGDLIIACGEMDMLTCMAAGRNNVTSFFGEKNIPHNLVAELKRWGVRRVLYYPDNDTTGREAAGKLAQMLDASSIEFAIFELPSAVEGHSVKDLNDLWCALGHAPEQFWAHLVMLQPLVLPQNGTEYEETFEMLKSNAKALSATQKNTDTLPLPVHDRPPVHIPAGINDSPYAEAALRAETDAVRAAVEGTRNNQLNRSAYSLGQLIGSGMLDRTRVEAELLQAARESGLSPAEATATLRSAINAGITKPRDIPHNGYHADVSQAHPAKTGEKRTGGKQKGRPKSEKSLVPKLARSILEGSDFAQDAGGQLYRYHNGVYTSDGDRYIGRRVKAQLGLWGMENSWTTHRAREVSAYIHVDSPELWPVPPIDTLNVANGLIDVKTSELREHSPDFRSPIQLPVTYEPGILPQYWDGFCRAVFPEDAYIAGVHWQIVAWLMLPITSLQKALMLLGDGGNGKSRYLAGLKAFLGHQHVTALSLQKIENDRFATARLLGKLANICPDLPSQHLQETAIFKQLTGDDGWLTGERKGQDSFEFPCFARLVFSANQAPISNDSSEAFYRRWLVQPFPRVFSGAGRVDSRLIDERLTHPEELSGVLNMALQYLPQVMENGITETESMQEAHREFRKTTDPLAVWLDQNTYLDPKAYVEKEELRDAFMESPKAPPLTTALLTQVLKRLYPQVEERQRPWGKKRKAHVYAGIGCRSGLCEKRKYRQ